MLTHVFLFEDSSYHVLSLSRLSAVLHRHVFIMFHSHFHHYNNCRIFSLVSMHKLFRRTLAARPRLFLVELCLSTADICFILSGVRPVELVTFPPAPNTCVPGLLLL